MDKSHFRKSFERWMCNDALIASLGFLSQKLSARKCLTQIAQAMPPWWHWHLHLSFALSLFSECRVSLSPVWHVSSCAFLKNRLQK
jgi:hypothetical protein